MDSDSSPPPASVTPNPEPLTGRVTTWYYRRMGILSGMLLLMGLYFLYDGQYGYPKANAIAEKKDWFDKEVLTSYDAAEAAGKAEQWTTEAKAKGWPVGNDGKAPRWASYAAQHGWPESPKKYTEKEVEEQFWWGGGTLLVSLIVGSLILLNRNKTLQIGAESWVTPQGQTVRFADVHRVDKRKWDVKGLAYAWYKENGQGSEKKAVIDDLKFSHAHVLLERLLANFRGELIEKVKDDTEEESDSSDPSEPSAS